MNMFKPGDRIEALVGESRFYKSGDLGTVVEVFPGETLLLVAFDDNEIDDGQWYIDSKDAALVPVEAAPDAGLGYTPSIYVDQNGVLRSKVSSEQVEAVLGPIVDGIRDTLGLR